MLLPMGGGDLRSTSLTILVPLTYVLQIVFEVEDPLQHYHIPLLISPFSYTTYRGS